MSWKKNAFSFFIWLLYIVLAGTGLICASWVMVDYMGYMPQYGILCAGVIALIEGLLVLLIRKLQGDSAGDETVQGRKVGAIICEVVAVLAFLVVGIITRIDGLSRITNVDSSIPYFEYAKVAVGQNIPQIVHAAEYFYLQLLHSLFFFMGNKISMAFWMQIILQLLAALILYRAVRRLVGKISAIVLFALLMCSTWMAREALYLSPNMMLLLGFAVALWVISLGGNATKVRLWVWMLIGAIVSAICYMDVFGMTLWLPVIGAIFSYCNLQREGIKKCFGALGMYVLGFVLLFCSIIVTDALLCGRDVLSVFLAWFQVYVPGCFQFDNPLLNINLSFLIETVVCLALFFIGVFTYWCRQKYEKISLWVCEIILVLLIQCFQFATTEVNGDVFLYVFVAILISTGIEELFASKKAEAKYIKVESDELETVELEDANIVFDEIQSAETEVNEPVQEESACEEPTCEESVYEEPVYEENVSEELEVVEIEYIPNPLPLPKKHEKKVLDYALDASEEDDFDFKIEDDDDFDIL